MIRIHTVYELTGYIYDNPTFDIGSQGISIKFQLIPDPICGTPYLSTEMALINVMVYKRYFLHLDFENWRKDIRLSEKGFLCDLEYEIEGQENTWRFVLLL